MPNPRGTYYKKPSKCELCHHVFVTPTALRKHLEQSLCIQFDKLTSEKVNEILNSKATNVNKGVLEVQDVFTYILSETRLAECSKGDVRVVSSRGPTNAFRHYESLHIPMIGFLMCRACEATFVKTLTNAKVHLKTCPMRKPRDGSLRKWDNDKKEYLDRSLGAVEPESRPNTCLDQAALIKAARVAPDNESATEAQGNSRPAVGRTFTSTSRKEIDQSGKSEPLTEEEDEESDSSTDFGSTYPRAHLAAKGSQAAEEHARRRTSSVTSVFEAQARHDLTPRTTRARAKDGEVLVDHCPAKIF